MTGPERENNSSARVVSGKLHPVRKGGAKTFVQQPPTKPESVRRPARVALMLALAHKIQDAINRGVVRDHGDAAKRLGLTWTRVTRLLDLTLLEPEIQEELLFAESVDGAETMSERTLRVVVQAERWAMQREVWRQF